MLKFNVRNQTINRVDSFRPAEKSVHYLMAQFNFLTSDWDALFGGTGTQAPTPSVYEQLLNQIAHVSGGTFADWKE